MLQYTLPENIRAAIAEDEPAVKAALCIIANQNFATKDHPPQGIGKYEGGIKVNGKEIAIRGNYVIADWKRPREPIAEEQAVVGAITKVADIIQRQGVATLKERYGTCEIGNPLINLMGMP